MKAKKFLALVTALCLVAGYATTIVDLEDGSTVSAADFNGYNGHTGSSSSEVSVAAYALRFGKDVTITLDASSASDGVFMLYANLYATNGSFTVDATGIDVIRWVGGVQTAGKVTVKGAKEIRFGERVKIASPNSVPNFSYFNTDVEFENGEARGLVFTNAVTCAKLPTSCRRTFAAGMRLAVDAYGLLGGGEQSFTLSDYDITLIETKGIAAGEIIVPTGRTLEVRQCSRTKFQTELYPGRWTWAGDNNRHVTNNITFAAGSVFYVDGAQPNLYFDGVISGEADFTAKIGSAPGTIHFTKSVSLAGTLTVSASTSFNLSGPGPFSFGSLTSAAQHDITGPEGRELSISELTANSVIGVGSGLDFRLGSAGSGARVNLLGVGPWCVTGPASGEVLDLAGALAPAATGSITLGGLLKLGDLGTSFSTVTLLEGALLTGTTFDPSVTLSGTGRVVYGGRSWKEKVALWVDSTDTNSFVYVGKECNDWTDSSKVKYNNRFLIAQWKDRRPDHDIYRFRNTRYSTSTALSSRSAAVYPLDENDENLMLNGHHTVSMWQNGGSSTRRINIVKSDALDKQSPITAAYAIMVFGAQSGGGAALLGTSDGYFARTPGFDKTNAGVGADNPISGENSFDVHVNGGVAAPATATGLSNGWQIVSMDAKSQKIYGIGAKTLGTGNGNSSTASDVGFQRYAEVMLFSEAPTETERKVAEEYLAEKWGLPCAHSDTREAVSLKLAVSGATASALVDHQPDDTPHAFTVNLDFGSGTVRGARYPILKCQAGDTYTLGTVTGTRRASDVALEYDSETGTLYAAVRATGFRLIVR